jgi:tetraacyldisaccharide 4'-kinase
MTWRIFKKQFDKISTRNKIILTTEKDSVRLYKFEKELKDYPVYVIPIEHEFLFNEADRFGRQVKAFIHSFPKEPLSE